MVLTLILTLIMAIWRLVLQLPESLVTYWNMELTSSERNMVRRVLYIVILMVLILMPH